MGSSLLPPFIRSAGSCQPFYLYVFFFLPLSTKVILGDLDLPNISIDESESVASLREIFERFFSFFFVSQFVY